MVTGKEVRVVYVAVRPRAAGLARISLPPKPTARTRALRPCIICRCQPQPTQENTSANSRYRPLCQDHRSSRAERPTLGNVIGLNPLHDYDGWRFIIYAQDIAAKSPNGFNYAAQLTEIEARLREQHHDVEPL